MHEHQTPLELTASGVRCSVGGGDADRVVAVAVLAYLLAEGASSSLTTSAQLKGGSVSRAVTLRLEDWLSERRGDMKVIAGTVSDELELPGTAALLDRIDKSYGSYSRIAIVDLTGNDEVCAGQPGQLGDP